MIGLRKAIRKWSRAVGRKNRLPAAPQSFEDQIYHAVVREADVCYDVGAHVGDVSLLMAKLAGKKGSVLAFEPVWPLYAKLCRKVQINLDRKANIVTVPMGLADEVKVASIQVPGDDFGMGSLAGSEDWSKAQPGVKITSYECRFTTLDDFLLSSRMPVPDFVKIDVEGAEYFVLRGANGFFDDGHRPLMLIELFAPWQRAFGYGPWKVLSLLSDLGYRFLFACPKGLVEHVPTQAQPFPAEYAQGYNLLAFCPDKHAQRIDSVAALRMGAGGTILPMAPPPVANSP